MDKKLSADYWANRYNTDDTPWDIGEVSRPLKEYVDGLTDKNMRILIPGAGKAHEAIYLHKLGFVNVYVCDWAEAAFSHLRAACPDFPLEHQLIGDFFDIDLTFDLVLEQTFFCAINPELRQQYANKVTDLLADNGVLAGLLFAVEFDYQGPPFGGTKEEYEGYFGKLFDIQRMDICAVSIQPRAGREFFVEMIKR